MAIAHSKLTKKGLVLVPEEVLQKLGIGPGAVLEWSEDGEQIVLRPARRYTLQDLHQALFPTPPKTHTLNELKEGIRQHMKKRYALLTIRRLHYD